MLQDGYKSAYVSDLICLFLCAYFIIVYIFHWKRAPGALIPDSIPPFQQLIASRTAVVKNMTRLVDPSPPASKTCKFRVAIGCPEKWKVQSIANYKKVQAAKAAKIAARIKASERNVPGKAEGSSHKNHIPIDHIKKELDILHNNSIVIRNKMMALSSVRTSLLWLLKKSNMVERSIIG